MARKKDRFEDLSRELIKCISPLEENEENFDLCLQFALSNFRFHRFLDVDSHKVSRAVEGVHEKFLIHSQEDKAKAFLELKDKFLESSVFEKSTEGKTDTHYAVLSLLLHLADSPTQSKYLQHETQSIKAAPDDFDWYTYLMDGEEEYNSSFPESPEWSDDDEFSLTRSATHDSGFQQDVPQVTFTSADVCSSCDDTHELDHDIDWLKRNIVVQYWNGFKLHENTSSCSSSNLATDWENYLSRVNPLHVTMKKDVISEHQIVREVLWMLAGIPELFIYQKIDDKIMVKQDLMLSHLTDESLCNILTKLANYGNTVYKLQQFVETTTSCLGACQTYQAFASSLSAYLTDLKKHLSDLEKNMIKQEQTITLASLMEHLAGRFEELGVLGQIYELGIESCLTWTSNSQKASHLLSMMYDTMLEWDTLGSNSNMVTFLLPIWIQTSQPYLDIIHNWITNGSLLDPAQEFVIQKNEDVQNLDENFWETAFTLQCTSISMSDSTVVAESVSESAHEAYSTSSWAPRFLQPVLDKVILAGKSMEMLQNLGRLSDVLGSQKVSLYESFIQSLEDSLGLKYSKEEEETSRTTDRNSENSDMILFKDQIQRQMHIKGVHDLLLQLNFDRIVNLKEFKVESLTIQHAQLCSQLKQLDINQLSPIRLILEHCLYPHVLQRYEIVCQRLLEILKRDYNLHQHMAAMRKFFLMESGDTMYDFYREIFEKLRLHEPWQDLSSLNLGLQEALQEHHQHLVTSLVVGVETAASKSRNRKPISALDDLTLHYKVPWPIDTVINTKCQRAYNQIFTFLLQIKRAKYCLDELSFTDLSKPGFDGSSMEQSSLDQTTTDTRTLIHRLHMFRMRLLHFANSLHNYIMTRILHSTGLEFQSDLENAIDLDEVISVHNAYVSKIHERCLLHKKVAFVKETVLKVLNLAPAMQLMWDGGASGISALRLKDMELEFNRCLHFLTSFLNNVIKRGSFPHLESLAFSLVTSAEYKDSQSSR